MPENLDRCVAAVKAQGVSEDSAFAICTAQLQKSGKLEEDDTVISEAVKMAKDEKKKKKNVGYEELNDLRSVEILRTGVIRGKPVDREFLNKMVANTRKLMERKLHNAPGKLGHDDDQLFAKMSGLPATGWVESLKVVGDRLIADFADMPDIIMEALDKKLFKKISSEVWFDLPDPETGEKMGPALRAVAFLGADIPEIKGLRAFLSEGSLVPLKLAESDYENAADITINISAPTQPGEEPGIDMVGFKPVGGPTIVGDPNELTPEGLIGEDLVLFREAEIIAKSLQNSGFLPLLEAPTPDSLMRWVGSVGENVCFSTPEVRKFSVDPERLCSWLQERAQERGLLRASEDVQTNEEDTQVTVKPEDIQKLSERLDTVEGELATAKKDGKESVTKLAEMTEERDTLQKEIKEGKLGGRRDAIAKFKEENKETLIPALHPAFDALCESVIASNEEVVIKLSDNKEEKISSALALVLKFTEEALKAKAIKLAEIGKPKKNAKGGKGMKTKPIEGATEGSAALDEAAMELIEGSERLSELYAKNPNAAYKEACDKVRIDNPEIEEGVEA